MNPTKPVTLITGASRGLGLELARLLARDGAPLVITARNADALEAAAVELRPLTEVLALAGDVGEPTHREELAHGALARFGRVDLLVNNASSIGLSPMPAVLDYPLDVLATVMRTNYGAPVHLAQLLVPGMIERGAGVVVNVTSDAGVEAYPGWGGYGASKAALEHVSRTLAAEIEGTGVLVYVFDPGDMDTQTHREAEPGVDLSHLRGPGPSAAALLRLLNETAPSGRYEARDLLAPVSNGSPI